MPIGQGTAGPLRDGSALLAAGTKLGARVRKATTTARGLSEMLWAASWLWQAWDWGLLPHLVRTMHSQNHDAELQDHS